MDMIKRFIYEFNLVSTDTVGDRYEWANILNNNIDMEIDYKNSISLYHLVDSFNKLYLRFKEDQCGLTNLKIKGDMHIVRYYSNENGDYERLVYFLDNYNDKMFIDGEGILYIERDNDIYKCYLTNTLFSYEEGFLKKELLLSDRSMKKYLEFGSKYDVLIDGYNYFKNRQIFGNGTSLVFTKVNGDLLNGCNTFEISLCNVYMNSEDYINIVFKLGDNLEIDYDSSIVELGNNLYDDRTMVINEVVKNIFINRDKIVSNKSFDSEKINNNVKKLLPNS